MGGITLHPQAPAGEAPAEKLDQGPLGPGRGFPQGTKREGFPKPLGGKKRLFRLSAVEALLPFRLIIQTGYGASVPLQGD